MIIIMIMIRMKKTEWIAYLVGPGKGHSQHVNSARSVILNLVKIYVKKIVKVKNLS